jgi:hypothetical protein
MRSGHPLRNSTNASVSGSAKTNLTIADESR